MTARQTSIVWEPAAAPFAEGECLAYATSVKDGVPDRFAPWWHVIVLESEVCLIGASRKVVRCQQCREDGAPSNSTKYLPIAGLFREVHP